MSVKQPDRTRLLDLTAASGLTPGCLPGRVLSDKVASVALADLAGGSSLGAPLAWFAGRSVLLLCDGQLPAVLALLQLDGVAQRVLLCPPDLAAAHLPAVMAAASVDAILHDGTVRTDGLPSGAPIIPCGTVIQPATSGAAAGAATMDTEWLLFTSGTTGRPKLVVHTLPSLTGPLDDGLAVVPGTVWSTFYDVRRYGGVQILLRALLGGASMVLSDAAEPVASFLARAGAAGVTHMSGTPSHWRRALMGRAAEYVSPRYIRLSGEVADQAILDSLRAAFPAAEVAHAFASTEAGVAFDVRDGLAGFPASLIGQPGAKAEMQVVDGSLRIRSARTASRYLGAAASLAGADGFVDTGDMVERRGDRYLFVGRREGVINVGGQKVHPEEVEAVINHHPAVQMSRVRGRANPITGALVVADIVLRPEHERPSGTAAFDATRDEILEACRRVLPAHKVPITVRPVDALPVSASGKLERLNA